jgi:hypothetical protein
MFMAESHGVRTTAGAASRSGCDVLESLRPELAFRSIHFCEDGSFARAKPMRQALRAQGKLKVLMTIMNYNDAGSNNF